MVTKLSSNGSIQILSHYGGGGSYETSKQHPKTICHPDYGGGASYETSKQHPKNTLITGATVPTKRRNSIQKTVTLIMGAAVPTKRRNSIQKLCYPDYGAGAFYETSKQHPKNSP